MKKSFLCSYYCGFREPQTSQTKVFVNTKKKQTPCCYFVMCEGMCSNKAGAAFNQLSGQKYVQENVFLLPLAFRLLAQLGFYYRLVE